MALKQSLWELAVRRRKGAERKWAARGAIAFRGLCVDVTASLLLRNLRSENNCYRINCVDNLLILLSTLFAFKLKVLLANLTCLLQEAFRLN